ncbi:MAG: SH3 domain-containing protein [Psychrobacter sp.]|nr:SH3 domain-containing protein [Psychrobacter sp.]
MKALITVLAGSMLLLGCGDTGQRAIKGAAEAVLKEDQPEQQVAQQPVAVQQQPTYDPNYAAPVNAAPANTVGYSAAPAVQDLPPKPVPVAAAPATASALTEEVVRHRATVLTQYGGKVVVRTGPSQNSRKLGFLYDQEDVWVVGITNNCEVINKIQGCWVKVMDSQRLVGYSFDGYLQY